MPRTRYPAAEPSVLPRRSPYTPIRCDTPQCGEPVDRFTDAAPDGWIYAYMAGSPLGELARWYCSPQCAAIGIAKLQLTLGAYLQ